MAEDIDLKRQFELPLVKQLLEENETLRKTQTYSDKNLENIKIPHIVPNKLLFAPGKHNGVVYTKEVVMAAAPQWSDLDIVYDHLDTRGDQGAGQWIGITTNPRWVENGDQGPGIYGDLKIVDKGAAQKVEFGAKFGLSPTIDFETNEIEGEMYASDLIIKSESLVKEPAVRATMLNSAKGGQKMGNDNDGTTPQPAKEYPYKFKKAGSEEYSTINAGSPEVLAMLEEKDGKINELSAFKEKFETQEKEKLVEGLSINKFLIGALDASELDAHKETLKGKSLEVLGELSDMLGTHHDTDKFIEFSKDFMSKNANSTLKDAGIAWSNRSTSENDDETNGNDDNKPADAGNRQKIENSALSSPFMQKAADGKPVPTSYDQQVVDMMRGRR
jgi:hypothetical protein